LWEGGRPFTKNPRALLFADRVALLDEGRLMAPGPPAEVMRPEAMASLYGIPVEMLTQGDKHLLYPD